MKLIEFLKDINEDKISLSDQIKFFQQAPIFKAEEIEKAVKLVKSINNVPEEQLDCLDICGTGGNTETRLNTSTLVAILLSCKGIPILKHGSKGMAGRVGSFDLLEEIGITASKFNRQLFEATNVDFLFAPLTYGSFKNAAEARRKYKKLTFMNVLGPLLNPYNPKFQIIGCTEPKYLESIIQVCKKLGKERALTYCSKDRDDIFLDQNRVEFLLLNKGEIQLVSMPLSDFGLKKENYYKLPSDTVDFQLKLIDGQLSDSDVYVKHLAINACLAEFVYSGRADFKEMIKENIELIQSGILRNKTNDYVRIQNSGQVLSEIIAKKIDNSKLNVPKSLSKALKNKEGGIIAEIKFKSPSSPKGFKNSKLSVEEIAKLYANDSKVVAISHVVDSRYFGGSESNIKEIKKNAFNKPILYKDFITSKDQIIKAYLAKADAVLLIQKILTDYEITQLTELAHNLNLEVMLELEDQNQIKKYEKFKIDVIGLNSRNLDNYKSNKNKFIIQKCTKPIVFESGILNLKDLRTNFNYQGYLIGTAFMDAENIQLKIKELSKTPIKKICGLRNLKIAEEIDNLDVDLIGINFVSYSKRKVSVAKAVKLCRTVNQTLKVGLFDTNDADFINEVSVECKLDFIQVTSEVNLETIESINIPVIHCFNLESTASVHKINQSKAQLVIVDAPTSGSGILANSKLLQQIERPFILAGGLDRTNLSEKVNINPLCIGFDMASGIEINGVQSIQKIKELINIL